MIIDLWPLSIKIDVLVIQIINVMILLFIFKKLFGSTLTKEVAERRELTRKLQAAEEEYNAVLAKAKEEKDAIVAEALENKKRLLQDAEGVAYQTSQRTLSQAQEQAARIVREAEAQAENLHKDLEHARADSVKKTAWLLVKKIFAKDVTLQKDYVDMLLQETSYKKNG